jgi:ribonucleoside-diphosphate reductase alpha chain
MATVIMSESASAVSRDRDKSSCKSPPQAVRNRLPDERMSLTHKFEIGGHEGYITVGLYPDGKPGELFITMAKEGSTVSGLINSFAQAISTGLQHGVPLNLFCEKFAHTRFEPCGWTPNPDIRNASSVMDYIFRWLQLRFGGTENKGSPHPSPALAHLASETAPLPNQESRAVQPSPAFGDAPSCKKCGTITTRNGSCYICNNCGSSSGCS